jgi:hypothetical protein
MLYFAQPNSRMKDFYDIFTLASKYDFEGCIIREAIWQVLSRRSILMDPNPVIFSTEFHKLPGKEEQWRAFCYRIRQESIDFAEVLSVIRKFLEPVYLSIHDKADYNKTWHNNTRSWA